MRRLGWSLLIFYAATMTVVAVWSWCRYRVMSRLLALNLWGGSKNLGLSYNEVLDQESHLLGFFSDWFRNFILEVSRFDLTTLLTYVLVAFGSFLLLQRVRIRRPRQTAASVTSKD